MPFDPALPQENTEIDAVQMRGQLNGLKDLIDAAPGITGAVVDNVITANPGDAAQVTVSLVGSVLHFALAIPRGNDGGQGPPGPPGSNGSDGATGPQGPPFAQAVIDTVNTLPAGSAATVSVMLDGNNVRFTFGIPAGNDGATGPPGEVTAAQLATAIAGTSASSNAVPTLDTPFVNDPPTLADMETLRAKMNELILALRR